MRICAGRESSVSLTCTQPPVHTKYIRTYVPNPAAVLTTSGTARVHSAVLAPHAGWTTEVFGHTWR